MEQLPITKIGNYTLVLTSFACPEQYDVYDNDTYKKRLESKEKDDAYKIPATAYLRLRHGQFRADVPFMGETVYSAAPKGDGAFEDDEREMHLSAAIKAIDKYRFGGKN